MSQANIIMTPEQLKRMQEEVEDRLAFLSLAKGRQLTPEMMQAIAEFLKKLDEEPK